MQSFRDNLNILFNEHDTISNFLNHQRILFVMITSSSMTFFYFLTTSQLFYINFSALRKFLQNIFFPLNLANATSSMIESNMLDMIWLPTETVSLLPSYLCFKTGLSHSTVTLFCHSLACFVLFCFYRIYFPWFETNMEPLWKLQRDFYRKNITIMIWTPSLITFFVIVNLILLHLFFCYGMNVLDQLSWKKIGLREEWATF